MHITRVYIVGFKRLNDFDLELNSTVNVIVGDNETGKTSVLEAINLVFSHQYDGRNIDYGLDPYLFNASKVKAYFSDLREGKQSPLPPRILIEVYLSNDPGDPWLAKFKGLINTKNEDCPGLSLSVEVPKDHLEELKGYVKEDSNPEVLPVEFYKVLWRSFSGNDVFLRSIPLKAKMIDTSLPRVYRGPNMYVEQVANDVLNEEQRCQLSLA